MSDTTTMETVIRRDRLIVIAALIAVAGLAWVYLGYMAWEMEQMDMGAMGVATSMSKVWSPFEVFMLFVMWTVMMVGMMTPAASVMIMTFVTINRRRREREEPFVSTFLFLLGYLVVWTLFSFVMTLLQWGLHETALLSPMMVNTSPLLGGGLLIAAGVFQWTPIKDVCLKNCRSPMGFVLNSWREGPGGAVVMGLHHGAYCTGCCWVLMLLLFVAGVMNLLWVAAITAFVIVEKLVPRGDLIGRLSGVPLVIAGVYLLALA